MALVDWHLLKQECGQEYLGCHWCDQGFARYYDPELLGMNPLHYAEGRSWKCNVPDMCVEHASDIQEEAGSGVG